RRPDRRIRDIVNPSGYVAVKANGWLAKLLAACEGQARGCLERPADQRGKQAAGMFGQMALAQPACACRALNPALTGPGVIGSTPSGASGNSFSASLMPTCWRSCCGAAERAPPAARASATAASATPLVIRAPCGNLSGMVLIVAERPSDRIVPDWLTKASQ